MSERVYEIPCEVAEDLLPSYTDGLTNPVTSRIVKMHLDGCEICRKKLERMKKEEAMAYEPAEKEIDYLKKTRRKYIGTVIKSVVLVLALAVTAVLVNAYGIARTLNPDYLLYEAEVNGNTVTLKGQAGDTVGVQNVVFTEEDGNVVAEVKGVRKAFWNASKFEETYVSEQEISTFSLGETLLYAEGKTISYLTSRVYRSYNPYVGDAPADMAVLEALGIEHVLGPFTLSLETDKEPYGMNVYFQNEAKGKTEEEISSYLAKAGTVVLAGIANLSEITFTVPMEEGETIVSVNLQEADAFAGQSVKEAGKNPAVLEELMQKAGLGNGVVTTAAQSGEAALEIVNFTDSSIVSISVSLYGEDLLSSETGCRADENVLAKGESLCFVFEERDFAQYEGPVTYRVSVTLNDGTEKEAGEITMDHMQSAKCVLQLVEGEEGTLALKQR